MPVPRQRTKWISIRYQTTKPACRNPRKNRARSKLKTNKNRVPHCALVKTTRGHACMQIWYKKQHTSSEGRRGVVCRHPELRPPYRAKARVRVGNGGSDRKASHGQKSASKNPPIDPKPIHPPNAPSPSSSVMMAASQHNATRAPPDRLERLPAHVLVADPCVGAWTPRVEAADPRFLV